LLDRDIPILLQPRSTDPLDRFGALALDPKKVDEIVDIDPTFIREKRRDEIMGLVAAALATLPASAAASVTWSFYETAIFLCNGQCSLPPQPFVLATLTCQRDEYGSQFGFSVSRFFPEIPTAALRAMISPSHCRETARL